MPRLRQHLRTAVDANPGRKRFQRCVSAGACLSAADAPGFSERDLVRGASRGRGSCGEPGAGIEKYARSQYVKFHAGDDGWAELLAAAKAGGPQVAVKPAPTPAEQAHNMIATTTPDKMDFATWEFVLSNGSQEDQDTVWNAIKGKAVQMNGTVMSTTPPSS